MSFQTKLLLVFVPLFIIVVGVLLYYTLQSERRIITQLDSDIQNIVHTVHYSTQKLSSKKNSDSEALERFIEEMKKNKSVREVSVVNSSEKIVASSNPTKVGQTGKLSGKEIVVKAQYGIEDSAGRHIRYDFVEVPIIRDNKVIGLLQTSIVVNDFTFLLRQLNMRTTFIATIAFLLMFGVALITLNRLNKPLRKLSFAAEQVASGDLSVHLERGGNDEVARLTKSFNTMTKKLAVHKQLEDKLRDLERRAILAEMAANLAHEIRNPLNLINLTADHLGHEYLPSDEQRKKSYTDLIAALKAEVQHLNKMVGEFLTIGRPSQLKKSRFSLTELFDQLFVIVKQQLVARRIVLSVKGDTTLELTADIEQMRLVFLNLILNAIEAVSDDGMISVNIKSILPSSILIQLVDNGPGIAQENLERIFEAYFSKRPGGTGLGLALARRIVEEHGGTITASNGAAGGAQFDIVLPINSSDGPGEDEQNFIV
jgi:two-component system, sporulation sensor kinase E